MDLAKDNCCPDRVSGIALVANIVRLVKLVWWGKEVVILMRT